MATFRNGAGNQAHSGLPDCPPNGAHEKDQHDDEGGRTNGRAGRNGNGHANHNAWRYSWDKHGIIWHTWPNATRISNFLARITADVVRDDGVEVVRYFEISAVLGEEAHRFEISALDFRSMTWVAERLGASAIIEHGMEQRVRHAIQVLSGEISKRHVFTHTGWRAIDGRDYFLHAGGALSAIGQRFDIEVDLPEQLSRVALFEPENDRALKAAVIKQLMLVDLAPTRISGPMLVAAYRAPLGGSNVTIAPWGRTGGGKTAFAAVIQQHFGPEMDAQHLPLHWESTANAIEAVLSAAKDVATVLDEYVPGEGLGDGARLQAKAERVIRAVGNASGRGRMRADLTLRPARPPRFVACRVERQQGARGGSRYGSMSAETAAMGLASGNRDYLRLARPGRMRRLAGWGQALLAAGHGLLGGHPHRKRRSLLRDPRHPSGGRRGDHAPRGPA